MKIAHILVGKEWSGGQNQVYHLMTRMNVESILITDLGSVCGKKLEEQGYKVYYIKRRSNLDLDYVSKLKKIISSEKIDIVNVHRSQAHTNLVYLKHFYKKFKLIVTRRVSFPQKFFSRFKYNTRSIDGYIAVSQGVKDILTECGISKDRIRVVYSGVDTERFTPDNKGTLHSELNIFQDHEIYLCIGEYIERKGQDILLNAIAKGRSVFKRCYFAFAGHGTKSEKFTNRVKELKIEDIVIPIGFRSDIDNIIGSSDVVVVPSLSEGFSGVAREALSMGKPVIATRVKGMDELIREGMNGLIVEPGEVSPLLYAIQRLYGRKDLQRTLGAKGREIVKNNFSIERTVKETLDYYNYILNK